MSKESKSLGEKGETIAATYLVEEGYEILERNWRWKKAEIDLICRKEEGLILVEVKTRSYEYFGAPDSFVTEKQSAMLLDAGSQYGESIGHEWSIQIDIIAIVINADGGHTLRHVRDVYFPSFE